MSKYDDECLKACRYANAAGHSIYSRSGALMIAHYLQRIYQFSGSFHKLYTDAIAQAERQVNDKKDAA